jgi:tight adherence protein C
MPAILILAIIASAATVVYLLMTQHNDRATVRGSLRRIENYEVEASHLRELELAEPVAQRVLLPVLGAVVALAHRLTPTDYVTKIRRKMVLAGNHDPEQVDRYLAAQILAVLMAPVGYFVAFNMLRMTGMKGWAVVLLLSIAGLLGPSCVLNRKLVDRRKAIQNTLPEVLDLLTISVEAGLGFEQALDRAVDAVPGPLSEELGRMLGEMRAGARRSDALRAFDERVGVEDVHSFALAILQADAFGVSITRVLRSQADEMRIRRRQLAQERAQKAPVKMLIPMVFCIFPALFVVVIGPAALNISKNFVK